MVCTSLDFKPNRLSLTNCTCCQQTMSPPISPTETLPILSFITSIAQEEKKHYEYGSILLKDDITSESLNQIQSPTPPEYSDKPEVNMLTISTDKDIDDPPSESICTMIAQIFITFLIAGFGMVGAGLVLDKIQHLDYFKNVSGVYIVIPPLLGLKGNLEMTLASRLSTLVNMENSDRKRSLLPFIAGNLLISQCLASSIGFMTSLVAISIDAIESGQFKLRQYLLLISGSVATAALSSFILDSIVIAVILMSRRYGINPDNVATPIAASLGDIATISLLAGLGSGLYNVIEALKTSLLPILIAMFISIAGGFILDKAVRLHPDIAVFQPIINGVGGNLVAIQASRISTSLHQVCSMGAMPLSHSNICIGPLATFFGKNNEGRSVRVLMLIVIPGHLIFLYATTFLSIGENGLSSAFVGAYLLAAVLQVAILLYMATILTYLVWRLKIDPDNFCIPILTAFGDLLGIGLLFTAFVFLKFIGIVNITNINS